MTYPATQKVYMIGKESTKGTPVTADKDVGLVNEVTDDLTAEIIESKSISAIETQVVHKGNKTHAHSVNVEFQNGRLFEFAVGEASHVETTGDWKHTFTIDDTPKAFTAESAENATTDTVIKHAGCLVENLELSIEQNSTVRLIASMKALTAPSSTSASAQTIDTLATLPHSQTHIELNSVEATELQNASIIIEKKVDQSYGTASIQPQQSQATDLTFRFNASLGFTAETYQAFMIDDTMSTFKFNAHNGVALGSGRIEVSMTLDNCENSKATITAAVGGLVFVELEGTGLLNELFTVDDISSANWF
jgi:hypothetical protein